MTSTIVDMRLIIIIAFNTSRIFHIQNTEKHELINKWAIRGLLWAALLRTEKLTQEKDGSEEKLGF